MSEPIAPEEKEDIREILSKFYGDQVKGWRISLRTFELLGQMIDKTRGCDNLMDIVPRPYAGFGVAKWAKKQVRQAVMRKLKSNAGKHYIICMKATSYGMATKFREAGLGL